MQHYPGFENPVLQALKGEISARQLRVMVQNLPQDNPVSRELDGPWSDMHWLVYDVSKQLRMLRAEIYNLTRGKDEAPIKEPELLPTPGSELEDKDTRSQDQVKQEQDHLLAVLNRPNPH